jgi:cell division protein FtsQ
MLKRINWKRIFYCFIWVVSLSGLVVLMSFIEAKKSEVRCKEVKIVIPGTYNFIERSEVDRILQKTQGPLAGRILNKINIHEIEGALKANPFIEHAKVFADMDGVINIHVKQREPVIRILNLTNQDFYIDRNGLKVPTSASFTARVLVANGYIFEGFSNRVDTLRTKLARDLYQTALFIEKDTLWNHQIEQLYVNQHNEIEMIPRVGDHKIILGTADSLQSKFRNLLIFYKKALPLAGWDAYKTISIKYANQIVCERAGAIDSTTVKKSPPADTIAVDTLKGTQDTTLKILTQ